MPSRPYRQFDTKSTLRTDEQAGTAADEFHRIDPNFDNPIIETTVVKEPTVTNVQGEKGEPGPQGPPGPQAKPVEIIQSAPSDQWVITHNLGRVPAAISVYDTANTQIVGEMIYVSDNEVILNFSSPFSGRVELI